MCCSSCHGGEAPQRLISPTMTAARARVLRLLAGLGLAAVWVACAAAAAVLSLFGTLMANDSGVVPASTQTAMVLLVLGGQGLAGIAGVPLGLACFWRGRRRVLLWAFAVLLAGGLLTIAGGVLLFLARLPG